MMKSTCEQFVSYIKTFPKDKDFEAKSLSAKYTTQNVIKCGFSIDAKCFESGTSEFREIGRKIFEPSFANGLKYMLLPILPEWIIRNIPIS